MTNDRKVLLTFTPDSAFLLIKPISIITLVSPPFPVRHIFAVTSDLHNDYYHYHHYTILIHPLTTPNTNFTFQHTPPIQAFTYCVLLNGIAMKTHTSCYFKESYVQA